MLRKSRRPRNASEVERALGVDADALIGTQEQLHKTNTYILEEIGGRLGQRVREARASRTEDPIFDVCDERRSILIYNKLYGVEIDVPVKKSRERENMHLFSTFQPHLFTRRLDPTQYVYEWTYGGLKDCGPDPRDSSKRAYALRPLVIDKRTQDVYGKAGSDFGWLSLLYENKNDTGEWNPEERVDPYPTGIVALEGWLFKMKERTFTSKSGRKTYTIKEAVDHDNLDVIAARMTAMIEHGRSLVGTVPATTTNLAPGDFEAVDALVPPPAADSAMDDVD